MSRILAIDYGVKRCGIAATDPSRIIASGVDTVPTPDLLRYLSTYCKREEVEKIVIGQVVLADGSTPPREADIQLFIKAFNEAFPNIVIDRYDEHYTSQKATSIIFNSGAKRKQRQDKALVDKVSAVVILEEYLGWGDFRV